MKMFNKNTSKVEELPKLINISGVNKYSSKLSQEQLAELGYFKIIKESKPSREYYTSKEVGKVVDGVYKVTYEVTEKSLDSVKAGLLKVIKESFNKALVRPEVPTSLGYSVDGGLDDLQRFQIGAELDVPIIKDVDGMVHEIDSEGYTTVLSEIKQYGLKLYQLKWSREAEVLALESVVDCILFRKTPYEVEQLVVDNEGEAILDEDGNEQFETVTKYRDNCKDI